MYFITPFPPTKLKRNITFHNIKSINPSAFSDLLANNLSASTPPPAICPPDLVSYYNNTLFLCLDKLAPLKTKTVSITHIGPWYTPKLRQMKTVSLIDNTRKPLSQFISMPTQTSFQTTKMPSILHGPPTTHSSSILAPATPRLYFPPSTNSSNPAITPSPPSQLINTTPSCHSFSPKSTPSTVNLAIPPPPPTLNLLPPQPLQPFHSSLLFPPWNSSPSSLT